MRKIIPLFLYLILFSCENNSDEKAITPTAKTNMTQTIYSKNVDDSFYVSVYLPEKIEKGKTYPVVYLLDANLYFDIMASTFKRYTEVGLLPPSILIGVGYRNFSMMDSLRDRDLTYPVAIPEYEMSASGGAEKFYSFITKELFPKIDSFYPVNKQKRILMGHSLGGYFTLFAMKHQLTANDSSFSGYIAASPSTHYDHNYILKEFEKINSLEKNKPGCFVTFGGLEEEEEDSTALKSSETLQSLDHSLRGKNKINYKGTIFSNLDHMDTGFPTFVKGLQEILMNDK